MRASLLTAAALLIASSPVLALAPPATPASSVMATGLRVADLDRAIKYYTTGLGMVVATRMDFPNLTEVVLSFETDRARQALDPTIILMSAKGDRSVAPTANGDFGKIVLRVADIDATVAKLKAAGYEAGPVGGSNLYRAFHSKDPDGHPLEFVQH